MSILVSDYVMVWVICGIQFQVVWGLRLWRAERAPVSGGYILIVAKFIFSVVPSGLLANSQKRRYVIDSRSMPGLKIKKIILCKQIVANIVIIALFVCKTLQLFTKEKTAHGKTNIHWFPNHQRSCASMRAFIIMNDVTSQKQKVLVIHMWVTYS